MSSIVIEFRVRTNMQLSLKFIHPDKNVTNSIVAYKVMRARIAEKTPRRGKYADSAPEMAGGLIFHARKISGDNGGFVAHT